MGKWFFVKLLSFMLIELQLTLLHIFIKDSDKAFNKDSYENIYALN